MRWDQLENQPCSIARTLSVIGDKWTLLILRDAFLRLRRFDDFQKDLGISRHRLSDRLKKLVTAGVFDKVEYQSNPARYEYRLTEKGLALYPVLMTMVRWGNDWMDDGNGPPILHQHNECEKLFEPVLACSECNEPIDAKSVTPSLGKIKAYKL